MNNCISLELVRWIEEKQMSCNKIFGDLAKDFSNKNIGGIHQISEDYIRQNAKEKLGLSDEEFDLQFVKEGLLSPTLYPKSKYQNRSFHHSLTQCWDNVDNITRNYYKNEYKTFPVEVASAYTGLINAITKPNKSKSEFAIIFDETIMTLSLLLSRIYFQVIPFTKENDGTFSISLSAKNIESKINAPDNKAIVGFSDLLISLIKFGLPCTADRHYEPSSFRGIEESVIWLNHYFNLFIMAHEYGHIHLNHFENYGFKEGSYESNLLSQVDEFEADKFAMDIVVRDSIEKGGLFPFVAIVGALLFFEYLLSIERCLYFFLFGEDFLDKPDYSIGVSALEVGMLTHPHAYLRRYKLFDFLKGTDLNEDGFIDAIEKFISEASNMLWNKSLENFKYCYYQNFEIHPVWNWLKEQIIVKKEYGSRHH